MAALLIAPPGTRIGARVWRPAWPGLVLRWGIDGTHPPYAVQRDGILIATGYCPRCHPELAVQARWPEMPEMPDLG